MLDVPDKKTEIAVDGYGVVAVKFLLFGTRLPIYRLLPLKHFVF